MQHVWTGGSFLGDAEPKNEDNAVTEQQIKGPDGGDFGSVQEDLQKQVQS